MAGTSTYITFDSATTVPSDTGWTGGQFKNRVGFDLIWRQRYLMDQMEGLEAQIDAIEKNENLSDTEKMFAIQTAQNSWNVVATMRTNELKSISDVLKTICRNVT